MGERGKGRMRGQGTRGTRRGGRMARSVQANPVDDKWKWLSTYANDSSISSPPVFNVESRPSAEAKCCDCPGDFFRLLFTDELVDTIVENTKVYATQKGYSVSFDREEILAYLGMNIAMGIVDLPEHTDYWTQEPMLRSPWFSCVMSLKRFKAISRFLHFADNVLALSRDNPSYDRLWKIRPVIDSIQRQSQKAYTPGKCVSVDESMIGTRGRLSFIQYMPKKPTKCGIKVWVCSESVTGYTNFKCTLARTLSAQMD